MSSAAPNADAAPAGPDQIGERFARGKGQKRGRGSKAPRSKKTLDPKTTNLLDYSDKLKIAVVSTPEIMRGSAQELPMHPGSVGEAYWNAYHSNPYLGLLRKHRYVSAFHNGWHISRTTENGSESLNQRATQALEDYMTHTMTPAIKKIDIYCDIFGMCPLVIRERMGRLVPMVPEFGTFTVSVWLNQFGDKRYTFTDTLQGAEGEETDSDSESESESESDDDEDSMEKERWADDKVHGSLRTGKPGGAKMKVKNETNYTDSGQPQYSRADVNGQRDELRKLKYVRKFGGTHTAGSANVASRHTSKSRRPLTKEDHEPSERATRDYHRVSKKLDELRRVTKYIDVRKQVFFIVREEPDYYNGQLNSIMSRLYPQLEQYELLNSDMIAASFENSNPSFGYEFSHKEHKQNQEDLSVAIEYADLDNDAMRAEEERATLNGLNKQYNDQLKGMGKALTTDQERQRNALSRRFYMLDNMRQDRLNRAAAIADAMRTGQIAPGFNGKLIPTRQVTSALKGKFNRARVIAPPEAKIVSLPQSSIKVDYSKEKEHMIQLLSSAMGIPASSILESLSGSGLQKSGGNSSMHTESMTMQTSENIDFYSNVGLLIFKLIFQTSEASEISLGALSVPYKDIFTEDDGELIPYQPREATPLKSDYEQIMKGRGLRNARLPPDNTLNKSQITHYYRSQRNAAASSSDSAITLGDCVSEFIESHPDAKDTIEEFVAAMQRNAGIEEEEEEEEEVEGQQTNAKGGGRRKKRKLNNSGGVALHKFSMSDMFRNPKVQEYTKKKDEGRGYITRGLDISLRGYPYGDRSALMEAGERNLIDPEVLHRSVLIKSGIHSRHMNRHNVERVRRSGIFDPVKEREFEAKQIEMKMHHDHEERKLQLQKEIEDKRLKSAEKAKEQQMKAQAEHAKQQAQAQAQAQAQPQAQGQAQAQSTESAGAAPKSAEEGGGEKKKKEKKKGGDKKKK